MITERIQSGEIPDSAALNESMTLQTRSITPIYDDCQKLDGDTPLDETNLNSVLQQNISTSIFSRMTLAIICCICKSSVFFRYRQVDRRPPNQHQHFWFVSLEKGVIIGSIRESLGQPFFRIVEDCIFLRQCWRTQALLFRAHEEGVCYRFREILQTTVIQFGNIWAFGRTSSLVSKGIYCRSVFNTHYINLVM